MKKIVAIVAAALMVVALPFTVMAAGSPEGTKGSIVSVEGTDEELVSDSDFGEYAAVVEAATADKGAAAAAEAGLPEGYVMYSVFDVHSKSYSPVTGQITITFSVPIAKKGMDIKILHYNGTKWEDVTTSVGDGVVVCTVSSCSPFMIVIRSTDYSSVTDNNTDTDQETTTDNTPSSTTEEAATTEAATTEAATTEAATTTTTTTTTTTASSTAGKTSPDTGEVPVLPAVIIIAAAAAAGMVITSRKKNA